MVVFWWVQPVLSTIQEPRRNTGYTSPVQIPIILGISYPLPQYSKITNYISIPKILVQVLYDVLWPRLEICRNEATSDYMFVSGG